MTPCPHTRAHEAIEAIDRELAKDLSEYRRTAMKLSREELKKEVRECQCQELRRTA